MAKPPVRVSPEASRNLFRLNLWVGAAHLVQAGAVVALSNDLAVPVTARFLDDDPAAVLQRGGDVAATSVVDLPVGA